MASYEKQKLHFNGRIDAAKQKNITCKMRHERQNNDQDNQSFA